MEDTIFKILFYVITSLQVIVTGLIAFIAKGFDARLKCLEAKPACRYADTKEDIDEMKEDRTARWAKHDTRDINTENYLKTIVSGFGEMKADIKEIKTNIDWLKKK